MKKAALIQIKYLDDQVIFNFFVNFNTNPAFYPSLHQIIEILGELLAKKNPEILLNFIKETKSSEFLFQKACLMSFTSLVNLDLNNHQKNIVDELFRSCLNDIVPLIMNIVNQKSDLETNQIFFLHYFFKSFIQIISPSIEFFDFIHFVTCNILSRHITYPGTSIINDLLEYYNLFYDIPNNDFQNHIFIKFNELIANFDIFRQTVKTEEWPVEFIYNIKTYLELPQFFYANIHLVQKVLLEYVFPNIQVSSIDGITDEVEFIDTIYPWFSTYSLRAASLRAMYTMCNNEILSNTIFELAHMKLSNNPSVFDVFSIINFLSVCICTNTECQRKELMKFYDTIISTLFQTNEPLLIISVMHFLSKLPSFFIEYKSDFIPFIKNGLFAPVPNSYIGTIIRYFAINAFAQFCGNFLPVFQLTDEQIYIIFGLAIQMNEIFKTDESSSALGILVDIVPTLNQGVLELTVATCQLFFDSFEENQIVSAEYLNLLLSLFQKCENQFKMDVINHIFSLFNELLHSNKANFFVCVYSEEIIYCLKRIVKKVIQSNHFWQVFPMLSELLLIIVTHLEDDEEMVNIDKIVMQFVNVMKQDHIPLMFNYFRNLLPILQNKEWIFSNIYSIKVMKNKFGEGKNSEFGEFDVLCDGKEEEKETEE
ncbi:hypothetical protein TRFO_11773 [Tritrichomonas foetus]|uniref:Uncharacterized protein n=1 Tax=Tritrichomonas foetus TaxID=1144522 RepID=A0A1J4J7Z4_9EUKA|nr:hypothetical protein TRFO_11773 [Tritrichomonas foetus]|eukprot:OHS93549.1 hypothetical protein TRFO_11773 [Tritrichomonas foetus]